MLATTGPGSVALGVEVSDDKARKMASEDSPSDRPTMHDSDTKCNPVSQEAGSPNRHGGETKAMQVMISLVARILTLTDTQLFTICILSKLCSGVEFRFRDPLVHNRPTRPARLLFTHRALTHIEYRRHSNPRKTEQQQIHSHREHLHNLRQHNIRLPRNPCSYERRRFENRLPVPPRAF